MRRILRVVPFGAGLILALGACTPAELSVEDSCTKVKSILESAPETMDDANRERIGEEFKKLAESAPEGFDEQLNMVGIFKTFEMTDRSDRSVLMGEPGFDQPWDVPSTNIVKTCEL
jgi:hypothetical protein